MATIDSFFISAQTPTLDELRAKTCNKGPVPTPGKSYAKHKSSNILHLSFEINYDIT